MQGTFNTASLAGKSRQELLSLLANLQGRFSAAATEADRTSLASDIAAVKRALSL